MLTSWSSNRFSRVIKVMSPRLKKDNKYLLSLITFKKAKNRMANNR